VQIETAQALPAVDGQPADRARVLLVLTHREEAAVARAALHLVGLPVDPADTLRSALSPRRAGFPILVVYDRAIPARSRLEHELLVTCRRRDIPLLCISPVQDPGGLEHVLQTPFTPFELLGAARSAQPRLYDYVASELVEPDLEDKLLLLTHDLRRATEPIVRNREAADLPVGRVDLVEAALSFVDVLGLRDIETAMHCYRVQAYARTLAQYVAPEILDDATTELGFLLHDIGKLALPDSILEKPGRLSSAERQQLETHPVIGAKMAARFLGYGPGTDVIRSHHERWDGNGYPSRIKGAAIPIEARVFAVADALDARTSDRPYRRAEPWRTAVRRLAEGAGSQFDPAVILALQHQADRLEELCEGIAPIRRNRRVRPIERRA
jgi:HD-GYP domain-containing protein (c-di-GMP phosphodiesterase class II)